MKIKIKWKCKPFLNWTSLSKFFPVSFLPFCSFPKHTTWASCLHFVKFPILFWTYWIWLLSVPASWMSLDQVGNSLPIASKQPKLLLFLVTLDFLPPLLPILFSAHLWMNEPKKRVFLSLFLYPLLVPWMLQHRELCPYSLSHPLFWLRFIICLIMVPKLESSSQIFLLCPRSTFPLLTEILQAQIYFNVFITKLTVSW